MEKLCFYLWQRKEASKSKDNSLREGGLRIKGILAEPCTVQFIKSAHRYSNGVANGEIEIHRGRDVPFGTFDSVTQRSADQTMLEESLCEERARREGECLQVKIS